MSTDSQIIIFTTDDEKISVDVRFDQETVWLMQQQIAELFDTARSSIVEHIKHIYEEGELSQETTCREFRQVRMEGNRQVTRLLPHYDLDMIIAVRKMKQLESDFDRVVKQLTQREEDGSNDQL